MVASNAMAAPGAELIDTDRGQCWRYVPATPPTKVVVLMHGAVPNPFAEARNMTEAWAGDAERESAVLVAPVFDDERYGAKGKSWLGYRGLFDGADKFIDTCVAKALTGPPPKLLLHGHSAGAQSALRYAIRYPDRVAGVSVTSCGSYAFPDKSLAWPLGMKGAKADGWKKAARIPTAVIFGEKDEMQLPPPPAGKPTTRVELGRAWIDAMNALVPDGVERSLKLVVLPGEPHSSAALTQRAAAELFGR